jgi:hypothetical protein
LGISLPAGTDRKASLLIPKLDCNFRLYHKTRVERVRDRGSRVVDTLPGAERAARELCLELAEYLVQRYPNVYRVERRRGLEGSWFGEPGEIRKIAIPAFDAVYDLDEDDPMTVAGLLIPDDLAIMMEGSDSRVSLGGAWGNPYFKQVLIRILNQYYLRAGAILLAGTWRLQDKSTLLRFLAFSCSHLAYMPLCSSWS